MQLNMMKLQHLVVQNCAKLEPLKVYTGDQKLETLSTNWELLRQHAWEQEQESDTVTRFFSPMLQV